MPVTTWGGGVAEVMIFRGKLAIFAGNSGLVANVVLMHFMRVDHEGMHSPVRGAGLYPVPRYVCQYLPSVPSTEVYHDMASQWQSCALY